MKQTSRPHDDAMVELLRQDAAFADEYLAASLEAIDEPGGREALLMALRQVAQAQGTRLLTSRRPLSPPFRRCSGSRRSPSTNNGDNLGTT